jgi:hypothetical protein
MTKKLTEKEFIEIFSKDQYKQLVTQAYIAIQESPEFKNNDPYCHSILFLECKNKKDNKLWNITIETTAKKLMNGFCDFGIVSMLLSDEEAPDEALDKLSEFMKQNEIDKKLRNKK